jgi:type II secretory pathway pseudopilin PulG
MELIVVMALILFLAGLTLLFWPDMSDQQRAPRGAMTVQQTLLNARNRALRDQAPRGVRLNRMKDPNTNQYTDLVQTLQYLEQPDDFVVQPGVRKDPFDATRFLPVRRLYTPGAPPNLSQLTLEDPDAGAPSVTNFSGGAGADQSLWPVQPGDYLEVNGGRVYQITAVSADGNTLTLASPLPVAVPQAASGQVGQSISNYRIIRAPRPSSEDPVALPADIVVDLSTNATYGNPLPIRTVVVDPTTTPPTTRTFVDILFAPSGAVVGQGTAGDALFLWVRDSQQPDATKGDPTLVAVQVRTGAILAYQVDTVSGNPYTFARSGRASGL